MRGETLLLWKVGPHGKGDEMKRFSGEMRRRFWTRRSTPQHAAGDGREEHLGGFGVAAAAAAAVHGRGGGRRHRGPGVPGQVRGGVGLRRRTREERHVSFSQWKCD